MKSVFHYGDEVAKAAFASLLERGLQQKGDFEHSLGARLGPFEKEAAGPSLRADIVMQSNAALERRIVPSNIKLRHSPKPKTTKLLGSV
jgi:hypothetical protein